MTRFDLSEGHFFADRAKKQILINQGIHPRSPLRQRAGEQPSFSVKILLK